MSLDDLQDLRLHVHATVGDHFPVVAACQLAEVFYGLRIFNDA